MMYELFKKLRRLVELNKFTVDKDKFKIFFIFEANNHTITLVDGFTAQILIDGAQAPITASERQQIMSIIYDAHQSTANKTGQSMDNAINEFLK